MKNNVEKVFVGVDCHKDSIACFVNEVLTFVTIILTIEITSSANTLYICKT